MKKRIISLLLAVIMVLGLVPMTVLADETCEHTTVTSAMADNGDRTHTVSYTCADCGEAVGSSEDAVVMDFISVAEELYFEEEIWDAMRDGTPYAAYEDDEIRFAGYYGNADVNSTSAEDKAGWDAAYAAARTWIADNTAWSIDEDWLTNVTNTGRCKMIMFNAGLDARWGVSFCVPASWKTWGEAYTTFTLNVEAPAAGEYELNLSYLENLSGAKFNLYINPEWDFRTPTTGQVISGLQTRGTSDSVIDYNVGTVTLKEGTNQLAFITTGDTLGVRIQLCDLTFAPITLNYNCPDADGDKVCDDCGADLNCLHPEEALIYNYTDNGDGTHTVTAACSCGEYEAEPVIVEHADGDDADALCDGCGICLHEGAPTTESYVSNGDETHTVTT